MFQYLVRRILWAIVLFLTITVVSYVIFFIIPADPAKLACGQRASPSCIRNASEHLGLDNFCANIDEALERARGCWPETPT